LACASQDRKRATYQAVEEVVEGEGEGELLQDMPSESFQAFGMGWLESQYAQFSLVEDINTGRKMPTAELPIKAVSLTPVKANDSDDEGDEDVESESEEEGEDETKKDGEEEEEDDDDDDGVDYDDEDADDMGGSVLPRYLQKVVDGVIPGMALNSYPVITIEGPSGSGKTTLCKRLALDLACAQLQYMDKIMGVGVGVSAADRSRVRLVVDGVEPPAQHAPGLVESMLGKAGRGSAALGSSVGGSADADGEVPVGGGDAVNEELTKQKAIDQKYSNALKKERHEAATKTATRGGRVDYYLPLVVPVSALDAMITRTKIRSKLHEKDLLHEYLKDKYGAGSPSFEILAEMHSCRRLIIMFDGMDEAMANAGPVLRYFLQTLVENDYPLLVITAASTQIPEEVRMSRAVPVHMCPLDARSQIQALKHIAKPEDLGDGPGSSLVKAQDMASSGFPISDVASNPMMLSQLYLAIDCAITPATLKAGFKIVPQLRHNSFTHSLNPKTGPDSEWASSLQRFREGNGIEIPFVDFQCAIDNDLKLFCRKENSELFYRVAYDTHQRKTNTFLVEDMEAVSSRSSSESLQHVHGRSKWYSECLTHSNALVVIGIYGRAARGWFDREGAAAGAPRAIAALPS
jgi:hypothetical protein